MKQSLLCYIVAAALLTSTAFAKRDPDVDKALKRVYPDAQTQVINSTQVNGVKVSHVRVTSKSGGEANAEVTDYGDFLTYGIPREQEGSLKSAVQQRLGGLFKTPPADIDMYRVTNYVVEIGGSSGKTYEAIFDAVGRLRDMKSAREIAHEQQAESQKVTGKEADDASNWAKRIIPDAKPEGVYKSEIGDNFYTVKLQDGGEAIVSSNGQLYAFREDIAKTEVPAPISQAIDALFEAGNVKKIYRGEWEFYQFGEQSPSGETLMVRMRPNGDILRVLTPAEQGDAQAMMAQHKEAPQAGAAETAAKKKKKAAQ